MGVLLDPEPTGRVIDPQPRGAAPAAPIPRDREMLARGLRGLPRQPLRALRSLPTTVAGFTDLPGANALPGVPTLSHVYSRVRRTFGADESAGVLEVTKARAAEDAVQRPGLRPPPLRVRLALARRGPPGPARVRHDGQRRRRDALRRRGARLAARARRAARGPAGGDDPDVGPQARRARRLGQPDLDDDRPDPDQRAGPGDAPAAHARAPAQRQGAPQRAARLAADRRDGVHPARGRLARRAQHDRHPQPHAPAAEPRDLQRPRPAHLALLRGRGAGLELPGLA